MKKFYDVRTHEGVWNVTSFKLRYSLKANPIPVRDSQDAARILLSMWDMELINLQEQLAALYLNSKGEAIGFRHISSGKLNMVNMDTPLILSCGLLCRAKSVILAHNHPSGDPSPSKSDIRITTQLSKSLELVGLELYDHIILTPEIYHSMADSRNFIPDHLLRR